MKKRQYAKPFMYPLADLLIQAFYSTGYSDACATIIAVKLETVLADLCSNKKR